VGKNAYGQFFHALAPFSFGLWGENGQ